MRCDEALVCLSACSEVQMHMAQQIGFTFLVPAHPGSPGQTAVQQVCVVRDYPDWPVPENTFTHLHPS